MNTATIKTILYAVIAVAAFIVGAGKALLGVLDGHFTNLDIATLSALFVTVVNTVKAAKDRVTAKPPAPPVQDVISTPTQ